MSENVCELTEAQVATLRRKYEQSPDGARDFDEFVSRVVPELCGPAVMLPWCGMWLGIERDGHAHS